MANLVADSILWGTQDAGAQIALMNVGGVRASLDTGDITYEEAYNVAPFGNLLNTVTLLGVSASAPGAAARWHREEGIYLLWGPGIDAAPGERAGIRQVFENVAHHHQVECLPGNLLLELLVRGR